MRYSRQEIFIGTRNQKKLSKATVAITGCGATGSIAAEYLARAGVNLRLIDRDIVELSNIHRQLFIEEDAGKPKAEALKERLEGSNSEIKIDAYSEDISSSNIGKLLKGVSLVLDGTDNMETRFLLNDYCMKNKLPFTYAAAIKSEALFAFILPGETACLRCFVHGSAKDTCETAGVLGPVTGLAGLVSAGEAIKFLLGKNILRGLLHINIYKNVYETIELHKSRECPACDGIYEYLDMPGKQLQMLCGGTYQYRFHERINVGDLSKLLEKNKDFSINAGRNFAQIHHKNFMISLFPNRMIVQNAKNEKEVRMLVAKLLGC